MMFYVLQFFFHTSVRACRIGWGATDRHSRRVIMITCTIVAATASELTMFLLFGGIQVAMLGWLWGVSDTYLSEMLRRSIRGSCLASMSVVAA